MSHYDTILAMQIKGKALNILTSNIDTDQIIPARYLTGISKTGLGIHLFEDLPSNPLDAIDHEDCQIIITLENFGCGSSREHAPWALDQFGFRAIIAPSFADIFFNNCFKNGLLPIVLPETTVAKLFNDCHAFPGYQLSVDLERQVVIQAQGEEFSFEVQAFRKYCLINGLDDIGLTLKHADKIRAFEAARLTAKPWLAHTLTESKA